MSNKLYEVELVKSEIEYREPMIIGFFILHAKLRMLELHYYFLNKFCYADSFGVLEIDTDSLYWALAENKLYDCNPPSKKAEWEALSEQDCDDSFTADAVQIFLPTILQLVHFAGGLHVQLPCATFKWPLTG